MNLSDSDRTECLRCRRSVIEANMEGLMQPKGKQCRRLKSEGTSLELDKQQNADNSTCESRQSDRARRRRKEKIA